MKNFSWPVALAAAFISLAPSTAFAQAAETRVLHSSGGSILQRGGRYIADTYKSPDVRRHARNGMKWGVRGLGTVASAKAAPIVVAAGTAYGLYEVGKFGYEWVSSR